MKILSPRCARLRVIALPVAVILAIRLLLPWLLKRAFAPGPTDTHLTPADLDLDAEEVWLSSGNETRLHAWFIPVDRPAPMVIVLHGWGASAAHMLPLAKPLHHAGLHTLFLDARNHGLSEHDGFTSMPRFAEDLDAAAVWGHAQEAVTSVGMIGHSVGAGAGILSASRSDRLAAIVAVSSPSHPGELMREQLSRVPRPVLSLLLRVMQRIIGHRFDAFAPLVRIGMVQAPVLLVHGTDDRIVPIKDLHALAAANPMARTLEVPGAGHSDLAAFEPHVATITAFLRNHLL